jgi:hypothetical protein
MTALPLVLKAAMTIILMAAIWRAFFGAPPRKPDPSTARFWGITAGVLYLAALYAILADHAAAGVLVGGGVVALCLAFWHGRGEDDGGGGDDGDDGDGPIDWDRFDRARRDWDRPLVGA